MTDRKEDAPQQKKRYRPPFWAVMVLLLIFAVFAFFAAAQFKLYNDRVRMTEYYRSLED